MFSHIDMKIDNEMNCTHTLLQIYVDAVLFRYATLTSLH